ncbi:hypothetical protein O0547_26940 [Brevibacillus laterosporus]|uniref:hypothetical protein n=1 Tax=Brevibacillus laterosporus TaxID=1465 RepID=UPI0022A6F7B0|nr:hypothetical protein [Brevibacillus laterosporus]MCZ0828267.1 hypothetical protein [Brevibacillus laterosporus]MCZ0853202.1 hypothetical protein [Brevibacillus laterosporus]
MSKIITQEILQQFKDRMHLDSDEDENLARILKASHDDLIRICGDYDITDDVFKELVFERSRYVYNDALEYFYNNFLTQINNLSLGKALESIVMEGDSNATI